MPLYLGSNPIGKVSVSFNYLNGIENGSLAMPTINQSNGLITSSVEKAGYINTSETTTLQLPTQSAKTITPSSSSQTAVSSGKYTTGNVIVAVPTETKSITSNGTYTPSSGKYFSSVIVNVSAESGGSFDTQAKTVTPTESKQTVTPDAGYDGLSSVTVNAISSTYVGSGVTRKSAATITPSETQQTISANQYLTGVQTIAAIPSDYIGSDVVIQRYYTGNTEPSSSLGSDGDIYLKS